MDDKNFYTMTEEEQDKLFPLTFEEKQKWQIWVPNGKKITNMQIYDAKSRGIPIPNGNIEHDQEYRQFLAEIVLVSKKAASPPPPIPIPIPDPDPTPILEEEDEKKRKHKWWKKLIEYIRSKLKKQGLKKGNKILDEGNDLSPIPALNADEIYKEPIDKDEIIKTIEQKLENSEIIKAIEQELEKDEKNVLVKIKEHKKSFLLPLIIAATTALLASSFNIKDNTITKTITEEVTTNTLTYIIEENISHEEALKKALENIKIGDEYYLSAGEEFNTNSLGTGEVKELGKEFNAENKYEGIYPITGFSIIRNSDNKMLAYIEDFYSQTRSDSLGAFVNDTLKDTDINYDDIRVEFHFGRTDSKTGERSRLGWLENSNVVLNEDSIKNIINEAATYKGSIDNFDGDYISITTNQGDVKIPIKDENGNYYQNGKIVVGSDNKEYQITNLEEEEKIETFSSTEQVVDGKKISFDIKDCNLLAGAPFITMALADCLKKKKMNKDAEKNPYYKLIADDNIEDYINQFQSESSKSGVSHKGEIYSDSQLEKVIINAYYEKTGKIESIEKLSLFTYNGKTLVSHKDYPTIPYDITDYINEYLGNGKNIGMGWDEDAAEYFEETNNKGRGR